MDGPEKPAGLKPRIIQVIAAASSDDKLEVCKKAGKGTRKGMEKTLRNDLGMGTWEYPLVNEQFAMENITIFNRNMFVCFFVDER